MNTYLATVSLTDILLRVFLAVFSIAVIGAGLYGLNKYYDKNQIDLSPEERCNQSGLEYSTGFSNGIHYNCVKVDNGIIISKYEISGKYLMEIK